MCKFHTLTPTIHGNFETNQSIGALLEDGKIVKINPGRRDLNQVGVLLEPPHNVSASVGGELKHIIPRPADQRVVIAPPISSKPARLRLADLYRRRHRQLPHRCEAEDIPIFVRICACAGDGGDCLTKRRNAYGRRV